MANAIILHRRRSEKIEPGSQTFTGNGVFVAPYSTTYMISITGSRNKAGNGGDGADGYYYRPSGSIYADAWAGGGGGGGGGMQAYAATINGTVQLSKGQAISITVTTSLVSFGNICSCASAVAAQNGISAISNNDAYGGSGGSGEQYPTISKPAEWVAHNATPGVSGQDGFNGTSSGSAMYGGVGGAGGTYGGGSGGDGGNMTGQTGYPGTDGSAGISAVPGNITISWGGDS